MRCSFLVQILLQLFLVLPLYAASVLKRGQSPDTVSIKRGPVNTFLHSRTSHLRSKKNSGPSSKRGTKVKADTGRCEPMFVAVLTTPEASERRSMIRHMWHSAEDGWGQIHARFAICSPGGERMDILEDERWLYDDFVFLNCTEGYRSGALTQKVVKAMGRFIGNEKFNDFSYFMKIDDDTFISPRRLCDLLCWRRDQGKNNSAAYLGVIAEGPNETVHGAHFPNRNPESDWYEPESNFAGAVYPMSAKGGPGYILSRGVVHEILMRGIAHRNMLNNEDKAVGVWVDALKQEGMDVDIVNVRGTDGYESHKDSIIKNGTFRAYPYALHHHLSGETISCLHRIDAMPDNEEKKNTRIDDCFKDS